MALPLSRLSRGVNRFAEEAGPDQCADALNVINDTGEVRRRDAFIPVGSAAPHLFPAGITYVTTDEDGVFTNFVDRRPVMDAWDALYVGSRVVSPSPCGQFDGIDFRFAVSVSESRHLFLEVSYWNGSAWTAVPSFVDETRSYETNGTYLVPFARTGRIYWHTSSFSSSWATTSVNSRTAWWIRLRVLTAAGVVTSITASDTPDQPGIRIFVFAPVSSLFPVRIENRASIVMSSDRIDRNISGANANAGEHRQLFAGGLERGAQLGAKFQTSEETTSLLLLEDEGPGTYGEIAWPRPTKNGVAYGSAGLVYGTASRLQKTRTYLYDPDNARLTRYAWPIDGFRGGKLTGALTPVATFSVNDVRVTASGSGMSSLDGFYRGCRIRCTTTGGTPLNEEREIWDYEADTTNVISVYPAWSVAPDGTARFTIYGPPAIAVNAENERVYGEAKTNTADAIELSETGNYIPTLDAWTDFAGHIRIGRELRWTTDAAEQWTGLVDPVTGRLIITNGRSGLLEFDGQFIRRLQADFRSTAALQYIGALPDSDAYDANSYRVNPLSLLRRSPPSGKYVVSHQSRVFVSGFEDEPIAVKWSAPGGLNNVWPLAYEDIVRDAEQDPITGMATLDERLIVFTPTAIHEAIGPDDNGRFGFAPLSQGIGFVGQRAVCVISGTSGASQLVGIAADGIYAYASSEPVIVLDDWKRLLADGVNQDALRRAVACAAPQKSWALFAVPMRGSNANNRILVWDFARNIWWVWSAPFGVSSMAVDYDEAGKERILFGTDDGYVMTLGDAVSDDGSTITAFALSPPMQPMGGTECSLAGIAVTALTLGADSGQQMEVDILTGDDADVPLQDGAVTIDKGDPLWGTMTWNAFTWAKRGFKTVRMNIVSYARAHRVAYRVGGSVRWALKAAEIIVQPKSRRGR